MIQFENCVERYNKVILTRLKEAGITCWIAGGCLRDYFAGKPIKSDIDLFFPDDTNMNKCVNWFKSKAATEIWSSDNGAKYAFESHKFDIVKHYFPSPQATIDMFDFTVSMFAVDTENVYHGETSFIDLSKRQLMINKITFPASTVSRAFRYYQKGYAMCKGEMKKLIMSCKDIPAEEPQPEAEEIQENSSGDDFFNGID